MVAAISAKAQVYVGGEVQVSVNSTEFEDDKTTLRFLPEVGYQINDDWGVGITLGYQEGNLTHHYGGDTQYGKDNSSFEFNPYARWNFFKSQYVNLYLQMGVGAQFGKVGNQDFTQFNIGAGPGISVNLNEHWSFLSKFGNIGYESLDIKNEPKRHHVGGFLCGTNLAIAVNYKF